MVRLATLDDLPWITERMLELRLHTGWSTYERDGYTRESLRVFLNERFYASDSVLYVSETDTLTGFCGGTLTRFNLPPHMLIVLEWGWFGDKRGARDTWAMVKQWGKRHGAELAYRVLGRPGSTKTHIREEVTWEVL